jgi:hypothetical protein
MTDGCGKVYHLSMESATIHADELEKLLGTRPDIYTCRKCGTLHVGYRKNNKLSKSGRRIRNFKKSLRKKKGRK